VRCQRDVLADMAKALPECPYRRRVGGACLTVQDIHLTDEDNRKSPCSRPDMPEVSSNTVASGYSGIS